MEKIYDVAIIGAGVSGCSIAMNLAKYNVNVAILEKSLDVAMGATKANSGIVHAGYDCVPDTLMAKLNVKGSEMMAELCERLDVPYVHSTSLVIGFDDDDKKVLEELKDKGEKNNVKKLSIIDGKKAREIEPYLSDKVTCALYAETASIVSPYELCIAMCENAVDNGAELFLDFGVEKIEKDDVYLVTSGDKTIKAKYVVNAAGVYADAISKMAGAEDFNIIPRKGEYVLLDKSTETQVSTVVFQTPSKMGKGVLTAPTVHGNVYAGPTAKDMEDKEDDSTSIEGLNFVMTASKKSVPDLNFRDAITQFAGIRAVYDGKKDFLIKMSEEKENFVQVAGICSPGLSASPAIGEYVVELLKEDGLELVEKDNVVNERHLATPFSHMTEEEKKEAYKKDARYGKIICRCETVTEAEIVNAIHGKVPALTLDSIKRRTRASMGRCQGGFCVPRIMDLLVRELGEEYTDIVKSSKGSWVIANDLREDMDNE